MVITDNTKPEEKPLRLSKNEIRQLKKKGFIILPASFMYPQLVGTPDFTPTARVKVLKEHFKNIDDL